MCVQNVFITIANQIRIRILDKVLLLKNIFEKMRNSDTLRQERLLDVNITCFSFFLGKTLIMTTSVQIKSFINDFRLFLIYNRTLF